MVASGTRSVLSGVIAGAGAWAAHTLSGGEVTTVAALVALALSVALGPLLLRARRDVPADPLRVAALTLLAQGVWHLVFMVSAGAGQGVATDATATTAAATATTAAPAALLMLTAHVLVAALGTAVAVGLDRSLVKAAARLAATLLPRPLVRTWRSVTPATPAPVMAADLSPLETARFLVVRVLRGPPVVPVSALGG